MRTWYLGLLGGLIVAGCGPSYGGHPVKTPDEIVAEQEQLGKQEQEQADENNDDASLDDTGDDDDQKKPFDKHQAKLELIRAARSAQTCVGVVSQDSPHGKGTVTLVFGNDGHVKKAAIGGPFADTEIGKCAINAMKAVIVPPFKGAEETMDWEVDLTPKKKGDDDKE